MKHQGSTYVGMDTSKKTIHIAMLIPDRQNALEWEETNDARGIKRLIKKLRTEGHGEILTCYEAGPCGYALQRDLRAAKIDCIVVAPSLVPVKPGERVKTNRRDARKLALQLKAGALTEVHPPTREEESVRDLCRCREDIREDLMRARHRLGKMLLRRGMVFDGRAWTMSHRGWIRSLSFEHEADRAVLDDYLRALEGLEERKRALEEKLASVAATEPWAGPVAWLRCFHGIDTVTALSIVAEIHGFDRFETARQLMAYLGLVPAEHSTGDKARRGGITRSGNGHVRRLLVEAAQHYRHKPRVGPGLAHRRSGQPGWVIGLAERARSRLHRRYWKLLLGGKHHNKAIAAIARELAGFLWAVMTGQVTEPKRTGRVKGEPMKDGAAVLDEARRKRALPAGRASPSERRRAVRS